MRMKISLENHDFHVFQRVPALPKGRYHGFIWIVTFPRQSSVGEQFDNVWARSVYAWIVWIMHRYKEDHCVWNMSDQCRAFNYFISHIYNNFHYLVTDNRPWWFRCGFMERRKARSKVWRKICYFYRLQLFALGSERRDSQTTSKEHSTIDRSLSISWRLPWSIHQWYNYWIKLDML